MKTFLHLLKSQKVYIVFISYGFALLFNSCKKDEKPVEDQSHGKTMVYTYEVDCSYCTISYTDENNQSISINNNIGKWTYAISKIVPFDLKLKVTTLNSSYQSIQAYILKNDEVVFGNIGYNRADLSYNTIFARGTSSYGSYTSAPVTSPTNPSPTNGSGPSNTPSSSYCGAKNKTGGYCKRLVVGGGRCWQYR